MGKRITVTNAENVESERFDSSIDATLQNAVYHEIYKGIYNIKSTDSSIDTEDFLQRLKATDVKIYKDDNLLKPYKSYWFKEDLTLLVFNNYDCCLCISSDKDLSLKFPGKKEDSIKHYNPQEVIDFLLLIDRDIPQIISSCKAKILKKQKKAKMKAMSKTTVTAVVKSTLKGTGIKYKLDLNENRAFLTVKLDHDLETKFALSYKDFMKKIVHVIPTVKQLNTIMQNLGQPLRIKGSYFRTNNENDWEESI